MWARSSIALIIAGIIFLPYSFSFSFEHSKIACPGSRNSGASTSWTSLASSSSSSSPPVKDSSRFKLPVSRREALLTSIINISAGLFLSTSPSSASTASNAAEIGGNLSDLPPEATRSYLQYRIPLAISIDFFIFDLQEKIDSIDDWGEIGQLFKESGARGGQGSPSRIEREFVNPMRILGLSMPPEEAEKMQIAQGNFERGMFKLAKAVKGIRRDIPIDISESQVKEAAEGWEEGRQGLNAFIIALNDATGLNELRTVPPRGPKQFETYSRSVSRYNSLVKKTKLCQNRGGPTLSQAWGGLMVTGYLQDSCGIPDLEAYFYQK